MKIHKLLIVYFVLLLYRHFQRLQLILQDIPTLNEESPDNPHTNQKRHTPNIRQHIRRSINVQPIENHTTGQVPKSKRVQSRVVQLGDIANHHRGSKQTEVLEAVLLRALGTDDLGLGRLVDALVALGVARVGARVLVVEFTQRHGVEVRDDGDDPCCGDGVERLQKISQLPTQFEIMSLILCSRSGATYEVAGEVEDVGGHGEGRLPGELIEQLPRVPRIYFIFVL